jgi:hypothetical protein
VTRRGAVLFCEDGDGEDLGIPQRLMGLPQRGGIFEFARNDIVLEGERNGSKATFATFSPDGRWLFVQRPGSWYHLRHYRPLAPRAVLGQVRSAQGASVPSMPSSHRVSATGRVANVEEPVAQGATGSLVTPSGRRNRK